MGGPGVPCIVGLALVAVVAVAGLILKSAVNSYNKFVAKRGGAAPSPYMDTPRPPAQEPPPVASANPYQASTSSHGAEPGLYGREGGAQLIPEPAFGLAVGIVIVRSIVTNVVGFIMGYVYGLLMPQAAAQVAAANQDPLATLRAMGTTSTYIPLIVANVLVSFFLGALMLKALLPTSYGKACLIQLIEYVVYFVIGAMIFGIVLAFTAGIPRI